MNELTQTILLILIITVLAPLTYLDAYFIVELPKKYGYWKFLLVVLCYLLILAVDIYLLSAGLIGLLLFFLIPTLIEFFGAYYYRKEIMTGLKRDWARIKENWAKQENAFRH